MTASLLHLGERIIGALPENVDGRTLFLLVALLTFGWYFTAQLNAQSARYDPLVQKVDNLWCRSIAESKDVTPDLCDRLYPTDDLGRLVDMLQTLGASP